MVAPNAKDKKRAVDNRQYAKAIDTKMKLLGEFSSHKIHFGRSVGPICLEMHGVTVSQIKRLGNWNPDIQDLCYSAKFQLRLFVWQLALALTQGATSIQG